MATYVNDLRLKEIATGDEAGTWGTSTNTNLELIAEAFSYGTEASFSSDANATTTIADGSTDPARSLYLKVTSGASLTATRTLTIAPNTVSKIWIIENATSGSQSITIKQGSGATVTIPSGKTKVVYSDGAGSGAAVVDAFALLNLQTSGIIETSSSIQTPLIEYTDGDDAMTIADGGSVTFAQTATFNDDIIIGDGKTIGSASDVDAMTIAANGQITLTQTLIGTALDISGDIDVDGTTNLDVVDIDGAVDMATTLTVAGNVDFNGDLDVDGTTNLDVVDIDGAVDMATTLTLGGNADFNGDLDVDGTTNLDAVDIDGAVDMASTLTLAGNADFNGDLDVDGTTNLDVVDIDGAVDMASTLTVGSLLTVNDGAIFNEGSADKDFRVESNAQTHALFVDGGLNNVGIGYSAKPTATLQGLNILSGDGNGGIQLNKEDGSNPSDGETLGSYAWKGQDGANSNAAAEASIVAIAAEDHSGSTAATSMAFNTKPTGTGPGSAPTERMRIDSSGKVGIGITPTAKLEVQDANGVSLKFGDLASYPNNVVPCFIGTATSALAGVNGDLVLVPRTSDAGKIIFATGNGGAATEKVRIANDGKVGIGDTTPGQPLSIGTSNSGGYMILDDGSNGGLQIKADTSKVIFEVITTGFGAFEQLDLRLNEFKIMNSGTNQILNITGNGIAFGTDTADANRLDDFEIGTWTPTIIGSTTNPAYTASAAVGDYVKIGNVVHACFLIIITGVTNAGAGNKSVSGLPFSQNQNSYQQVGLIGYNDVWTDAVTRFYITGQNLTLMPAGVTQSNYTGDVTTGYFSGCITYTTSS